MNKKLLKKVKNLPRKPGVYLFFAKGESASGGKDAAGRILYIGKAINIRERALSHFKTPRRSLSRVEPRGSGNNIVNTLINKVADIDFIEVADAKEALILENELIKKYKPKYNVQWRDDKSYFWISFSDDEWPRVKVVHNSSLRGTARSDATKQSRYGAAVHGIATLPRHNEVARNDNFIGPFTNGTELKQVLRALRKILPYRTCKNPYDKPCLQWHLGLCPAHGPLNLLPEQTRKVRRRLNINPSTSGRTAALRSGNKNNYLNSLVTLRQLLRLYAGEPIRIEAYDISNIQGANATGSMIVFKGFKPDKSQYRKFKIKTVRGANDAAMLKEVLRRRLNHLEWPLPDLILIDGGRGQLNAVQQIAKSQWPTANNQSEFSPYAISHKPLAIIALAKRVDELYTIYSNRVLRLSALPTDLRLLFQAVRNEAHRFAISYYRKLHRKKISIK